MRGGGARALGPHLCGVSSVSIEAPTLPLISVESITEHRPWPCRAGQVVLREIQITVYGLLFLSEVTCCDWVQYHFSRVSVCHVSIPEGMQSHNRLLPTPSDLTDTFHGWGSWLLVPTGWR